METIQDEGRRHCFAQQTDSTTSLQSVTIDEVIVTAARIPTMFLQRTGVVSIITTKELKSSPAAGLDEVLKGMSSVDLRQRGGYGVQSDVSIRGGHYEQTLIP